MSPCLAPSVNQSVQQVEPGTRNLTRVPNLVMIRLQLAQVSFIVDIHGIRADAPEVRMCWRSSVSGCRSIRDLAADDGARAAESTESRKFTSDSNQFFATTRTTGKMVLPKIIAR